MAKGEVGILNVGAGDDKLVFDRNDPKSMIRGARIVRDMIRRGYALLVEVPSKDGGEPTYQRAYDFSEDTCEYIIADLDPDVSEKTTDEPNPAPTPRGRGTTRTKKVHAADTRVVSVSRTAGG